ncbi:MAG: PEP-CTERM sorting domain-containing protein [Rubrivivax sp.]|nr:MAG: PEP-CTERM sorting domain-containing protein [Rubrivivax sp.]
MKFALRNTLAVAAFLAAGAVGATPFAGGWALNEGTGSLTFSQDALSALSASSSNLRTPSTIPSYDGGPAGGAANTASVAQGIVGLTFSSANVNGDSLVSLQAANSFVDIKRTTIDENDVQQSNSILMANFDVNLANSTIYADLYTRNNTAGTTISFGKKAIFTADVVGVVGGTEGKIVVDVAPWGGIIGRASGSLAGSLRMNLATAEIILTGLGLSTSATDPVATLVRTANWGNTTASGTFVVPIPEPSSWALMAVGLLTLGIASRRKQAA